MASWNWVSQCTRITPNFLYCCFKAYFRFRFNSVSVRAVLRTNGPRQLNCILGSCYWFLLFKVVKVAYFRFRFNSVSVRAVLRTNGPRQLNCILGSCYWFLLFKVVNRWLKRTTSSVGPWRWPRTTRRWWRTWLKRPTSLCFLRCYLRTVFRFFSFCFRTGANGLRIDFDCTRSDSVKVYKSSFFVLLIWLSVNLRIVKLVICDWKVENDYSLRWNAERNVLESVHTFKNQKDDFFPDDVHKSL